MDAKLQRRVEVSSYHVYILVRRLKLDYILFIRLIYSHVTCLFTLW